MLQIPSFVYRSLLFISLTAITARLSAQAEMLQQQHALNDNKNVAATAPVKKNYDEEAKSWYSIYNTDNSLHVHLAVTDPQQQEKIVMNGVQLWIDTKGKKNKKTGILYPFVSPDNKARPSAPDKNQLNFNTGGHDTISVKLLEAALAANHEMQLTGFKDDLNGVQNNQHPSGISVSIHFTKDTLFYEAQLPLNTLPDAPALNSHISVGIVEKGMPMPGFNGGGMPSPDGGGGPGGDGMMPPPGGPPPGGEEGMRIFEDDIIWYKLSFQDIVFVR